MLYELTRKAAAAESIGGGSPPADAASLARLEAALAEDAALEGTALDVALTKRCGAIEVRVSGPTAGLRLSFDRAELDLPYVRQVVRNAVARYRSALGHQPSLFGKE
jgi:hypothetical protein